MELPRELSTYSQIILNKMLCRTIIQHGTCVLRSCVMSKLCDDVTELEYAWLPAIDIENLSEQINS